MSLDPTFSLVCGIEAVENDPRLHRDPDRCIWDEDIPPLLTCGGHFDWLIGCKPRGNQRLDRVYREYHPGSGWTESDPIAGYVAAAVSSDMARILALYLDRGTTYCLDGNKPYYRFGNREMSSFQLERYQQQYGSSRVDKAVKQNRFLEYFDVYDTLRWYTCASYVMRYVGWRVKQEDFGIYLVYEWT